MPERTCSDLESTPGSSLTSTLAPLSVVTAWAARALEDASATWRFRSAICFWADLSSSCRPAGGRVRCCWQAAQAGDVQVSRGPVHLLGFIQQWSKGEPRWAQALCISSKLVGRLLPGGRHCLLEASPGEAVSSGEGRWQEAGRRLCCCVRFFPAWTIGGQAACSIQLSRMTAGACPALEGHPSAVLRTVALCKSALSDAA